jgi:pyridoxine 5'-phosphate synthase PdxJ
VYDQLIKFRHDAGDAYKDMCEALKLIGASKEDYASIARQLNVTCFDKHGRELRQFATEAQLKELSLMESIIATNIRAGLLKSIAAVKVFIVNYQIRKKTV